MIQKFMPILFCGISLLGALTACSPSDIRRYDATLVAPDALTTDAPRRIVAASINKVYEEIFLRHFMDSKGNVRFADGTATNSSKRETARSTGDFIQSLLSFADPDGDEIVIRTFSSPDFGTLIAWEYGGGKDVQDISIILQQGLAQEGVELR